MSDVQADKINRVVVRGTNWVGDAVISVPALKELRHLLPHSNITLATRSWAEGMFAGADFIDELLVSDQRNITSIAKQASAWRKQNFDLALIFPNSFSSALVPALARVPIRVGYATDRRGLLLTNAVKVPEWRKSRHEKFYYLNLVNELAQLLGFTNYSAAEQDCSLDVSAERKREAVVKLRSNGVVEGHTIVALCPGSTNSRAKRWPAERFAAVADRLKKELGANVLLIGSADELEVSEDVASRMTTKPIVLTGQTDLAQVTAILSQVDLLITNDTGPAHVAAALDRPTIVIFGPTDPVTTGPISDRAEIVRKPPDCAPCMWRECPIDHRCMTAIEANEVYERARVLLKSQTPVVPALAGGSR